MRHPLPVMFVLALSLALVLSSCGLQPGTATEPAGTTPAATTKPAGTTPSGEPVGRGADLMAKITAAPYAGPAQVPDAAALAGINRFAAELLLAALADEGNVMVSPVSVFLALAMTANGARGETEKAML